MFKKVKALDYEFSINEEQIRDYRNAINQKKLISDKSKLFKKLLGKKVFL